MTWDELKQKSKEFDETKDSDRIDFGYISFYEDGSICCFQGVAVVHLAVDRTPDQMLAIMKALQ